jgi:hypothetical protein
MSGTRPMQELTVQTTVALAVGLSKVPRMKFPWGARAEPISLGLRGQWAILADHVQDVHAYLGFDGQQLLVAPGAPGASVLVNGQPIQGQAWVAVSAPARIQLGEAQLRIENEGRAEATTAKIPVVNDLGATELPINSTIDTLFDGGVLRERARAITPAPIAPMPVVPTLLAAGVPRAGVPFEATLQSATPPPNVQPQVAARGRSHSQPQVSAAVKASPTIASPTNKASPSTPPPTAVTQPPPAAKKGAWAEASGPKKAIFVLMPFALATMMWVILDDSEQQLASAPAQPVAAKPAGAKPDAAASEVAALPRISLAKTPASPASAEAAKNKPQDAEPSATSRLSTSPAPSAAPAAASAVPSAAAPSIVTPPGASPRAALNAALLGNLDQAAELYAKLSAADPSNQAFSLAARLTAAHAVRHP